jgi:hypothetical protein
LAARDSIFSPPPPASRAARDTFASLSAEALRQNNQSFLALAQTKLGEFQW